MKRKTRKKKTPANKPSARCRRLEQTVRALERKFSGTGGFHAVRLDTGEEAGVNADRDFPTASIVKIAILAEVLRQVQEGRLRWKRRYTYRPAKDKVGGSGVLRYLDGGLRLTLHDWSVLMMSVSDNIATNVLIDLAGVEAINRNLKRNQIAPLRLRGRVFRKNARPKGTRHFAQGTPRAWTTLMRKLVHGEMLSPKYTEEALRIMRIQAYITGIRKKIPLNPWEEIDPKRDRRKVWIASKPGGFRGFRGEVGVIHLPGDRYLAMAVLGENCKDLRWAPDNEGNGFVSDCAFEIWKALKD